MNFRVFIILIFAALERQRIHTNNRKNMGCFKTAAKALVVSVIAIMSGGGCSTARYAAFPYDNGDDYLSEGMYRIVDRKGRIGYADADGRTAIKPIFAFGYPFQGGKAKVTDSGSRKEVAGSGGEHWYWASDEWYYIDKEGNRIEQE